MTGTPNPREVELYDRITDVFVGCPAETIIPVICEALVHAINCAAPERRDDLRDAAVSCLQNHVSNDAPVTFVVRQ